MAVILPIIFYTLLTRVLYLKYPRSLPFALLAAAVMMGTGTILLTELLSFFKLLSYPVMAVLWLIADIVIFWRFQKLKWGIPRLDWPQKIEIPFVMMAGVLFILVLLPVSLTAIKAAPGTWDSMTYHLARVEHWVQNRSLDFYPTNIERQLWKDYGAEIFVLHFRILTGTDRFCNIVQLLAWWGCMLAAWAMLDLWQRGRWEKLLAVVLIATIPMAILQASSTQGDLIGSFWLMAFVYFLMDASKSHQKISLVLCGLALGMALLTRETNYLYAWPFVFWLAISKFKSKGFSNALLALGIILGGIVLVNAGHYARNISFYHRILSPGTEDLVNEHWTMATLLINAVRNTFMHITTPFIAVNDNILGFVEHWAQILGVQIQDRSSMVTDQFNINALFLDEDYAQNPLHVLLLLVLMVYAALRWMIVRKRQDQVAGAYVLALVVGMATFSLILKWQPWNSRLHVGIFMLSAVPIAVMIGRLRARWVMITVMIFFIIPSLLWVFRNDNRPLIGPASIWRTDRHEQYYQKRHMLAIHDKTASEIFNKVSCTQVGLIFGEDTWEYPFWVLMREHGGDKVRMEHVAVNNTTKDLPYPLGNFIPCGIYMQPSDGRNIIVEQERAYARVWETSLPDGSKSAVFLPVN
jgi:hypothetical protein